MDNDKSKPGKAEKLTELQAMFVREYVVDFVAGRAYQRAQKALGRKVGDTATADQEGSRMLGVAKVRAACDVARDAKKHNPEDMRERIIDELVAIAYSSPEALAKWVVSSCARCWDVTDPRVTPTNSDAINPDCKWCRGRGTGHISMTPTDELSHAERRLFDGIEYTATGVRVKLRDRTRALEMLARHFGVGPERLEISGRDGGPIEVIGARDRLLASLNRRPPVG